MHTHLYTFHIYVCVFTGYYFNVITSIVFTKMVLFCSPFLCDNMCRVGCFSFVVIDKQQMLFQQFYPFSLHYFSIEMQHYPMLTMHQHYQEKPFPITIHSKYTYSSERQKTAAQTQTYDWCCFLPSCSCVVGCLKGEREEKRASPMGGSTMFVFCKEQHNIVAPHRQNKAEEATAMATTERFLCFLFFFLHVTNSLSLCLSCSRLLAVTVYVCCF